MERTPKYASFMAALGAGIAIGVFSGSRRRGGTDAAAIQSLKRSLTDLEGRMTSQLQSVDVRFRETDARLDEQAAKLAQIPSTTQIVDAIEQLITKSMLSLDKRLTAQAASIEVLRTTVSQTDSFLERFLESQGSLQENTPLELLTPRAVA
jgi:hypothetical protein